MKTHDYVTLVGLLDRVSYHEVGHYFCLESLVRAGKRCEAIMTLRKSFDAKGVARFEGSIHVDRDLDKSLNKSQRAMVAMGGPLASARILTGDTKQLGEEIFARAHASQSIMQQSRSTIKMLDGNPLQLGDWENDCKIIGESEKREFSTLFAEADAIINDQWETVKEIVESVKLVYEQLKQQSSTFEVHSKSRKLRLPLKLEVWTKGNHTFASTQ